MFLKISRRYTTVNALRFMTCTVLLSIFVLPHHAAAQSKNRAQSFDVLPKAALVVIMPTDIELFEISAGGVLEPKADWTEAASRHFGKALQDKKNTLGLRTVVLSDKDADDVNEINTLHAAVARSISLHHFGPGMFYLPTKEGKLNWSMGESVRVIKQKTGADYALFSWVRDSYASGERIASIVIMAMLGVGLGGGMQVGYASLVDLNTGNILWFNQLLRASGDLREAPKAVETLNALLQDFPVTK